MNVPTSPLRLDILDPARQELLWQLLPLLPDTAVLAGGTALALQLGHRLSYDFDFFLATEVPTGEDEVRHYFRALVETYLLG